MANAEEPSQGTYDQLIYTKYADRVEITGCDKSISGSLEIPAEIDGLPVTAIGANAFNFCQELLSVVISDNVQSIRELAFGGCSSLTSVIIPANLKEIQLAAFENCENLKEIVFPEGMVSIGDRAFNGCINLSSVTIPETVYAIGNSAFQNCSALSSAIIGNSVKNIGNSAFSGCTSLHELSLSSELIAIGQNAFSGCTSLTAVDLPASLRNMGSGVFMNCAALTEVNLPAGTLLIIPESLFSGCTSLHEFSIPEGTQKVEKNAFSNCVSLKSLTFPSSVASIGASVCGQTNLESVTIKNTSCVMETAGGVPFSQNTVIYGYANSTAQTYAQEQGNEFQLLEGNPDDLAVPYRLGEVNGDGKINILDVILVNKAIYGKAVLTEEQVRAADVNRTGSPDASDSLMIIKYIVRLISSFI